MGAGSTKITATYSDFTSHWFLADQSCIDNLLTLSASANVTVTPRVDSISPSRGPIATTVSVTINGSGFGTTPTVNAGTGITVTINSKTNTQIQASFAISSTAPTGDHAVTVTASGQTSNSVNFFVQVPTYFTPTNAGTALNTFCAPNQAFYAYVDYQVSDQLMNSISAPGWTPQESVSVNGGSYSAFQSFATPVSTTASGSFEDIPIGTCFSAPPPPNRCIPVVQRFQILVPGVASPFPITTETSRTDCEQGIQIRITPGTTYTFGTIN